MQKNGVSLALSCTSLLPARAQELLELLASGNFNVNLDEVAKELNVEIGAAAGAAARQEQAE